MRFGSKSAQIMIDSDDLGIPRGVIIINQLYLESYWELDAPLETTSMSACELFISALLSNQKGYSRNYISSG